MGSAYTVRLTPEVAEQVELLRLRFQEEAPFAKVSMSDVLRHLITEGTASATASLSKHNFRRGKKQDE